MKVNFNNFANDVIKSKIIEIFNTAVEFTKTNKNISANIIVVGREKIRQMNKEFRGVDRVTDVLSFPLYEREEIKNLSSDNEEFIDIGDIVICKSKANSQAKEYGHCFEREFCFLALHGLLHILGYDHIEKSDEKIMFALQDKILKKVQMER